MPSSGPTGVLPTNTTRPNQICAEALAPLGGVYTQRFYGAINRNWSTRRRRHVSHCPECLCTRDAPRGSGVSCVHRTRLLLRPPPSPPSLWLHLIIRIMDDGGGGEGLRIDPGRATAGGLRRFIGHFSAGHLRYFQVFLEWKMLFFACFIGSSWLGLGFLIGMVKK